MQTCGRGSRRSGRSRLSLAPAACPRDRFESLLPEMELLIGQTDMPRERLMRARETARHRQRRNELFAKRRLRDLFREGHPCARPQRRLRQTGRRDDARHGHRPMPRHHQVRPRDAARRREVAARRLAGLEFAVRRIGGPHRLRRPRARFRSARGALRLLGVGLRSLGFRAFHERLWRQERNARRDPFQQPGDHRVRRSHQRKSGLFWASANSNSSSRAPSSC